MKILLGFSRDRIINSLPLQSRICSSRSHALASPLFLFRLCLRHGSSSRFLYIAEYDALPLRISCCRPCPSVELRLSPGQERSFWFLYIARFANLFSICLQNDLVVSFAHAEACALAFERELPLDTVTFQDAQICYCVVYDEEMLRTLAIAGFGICPSHGSSFSALIHWKMRWLLPPKRMLGPCS